MANFEEIATTHADKLVDKDYKTFFGDVNAKLTELGYEVLINDKKNAEFIPAGRLADVVGQRDGFKSQVQTLNAQLEAMKKQNPDNQKMQADLQQMIDSNNALMLENERIRVDTEIMLEAKDAIDPKDLLLFINRDKVKANAKGEVVGAKEEVARLRTEKPHLFNKVATGKGGKDPGDNKPGAVTGGMNSMIRKASGRSF